MSKSTAISTIDAQLESYDRAARQEYGLEVITESEEHASRLSAIAEIISDHIGLITKHEDAFQEATLEPRLLIGQQILAAQEIFGLTRQQAGNLGGRPSTSDNRVTRDTVSDEVTSMGFSGWLAANIPALKRPHAYKLATAYKALSLPADASLPKIRDAVKTLRHKSGKAGEAMPTIDTLYRAGKPPKDAPKLPAPENPADLAGEARVNVTVWIETWDKIQRTGDLDYLGKPDLAPLEQFLTTTREYVRHLIKSSSK
jgi:hypothetical protein